MRQAWQLKKDTLISFKFLQVLKKSFLHKKAKVFFTLYLNDLHILKFFCSLRHHQAGIGAKTQHRRGLSPRKVAAS
jgi:hypothetical protein